MWTHRDNYEITCQADGRRVNMQLFVGFRPEIITDQLRWSRSSDADISQPDKKFPDFYEA
jgi:hypothetical protein